MTTRVIPLRARRRKPRGHTVVTLDTFENLAHSNGWDVDLPVGGGWVTGRIGSMRLAAWLPPSLLLPEPVGS